MPAVRWLAEARREVEGVALYYAKIDVELADELWTEIRRQLERCERFPAIGTRVRRVAHVDVRRFLTARFPYAVVIARVRNELVVVAMHHQRRRPGYWKARVARLRG